MARADVDRERGGVTLMALGAMLAVGALAACSGGKANRAAAAPPAGMAASDSIPNAAPETPTGATLFQRCATCHQLTGQGLAGSFPPLAGSEWANAREVAVPIRIVLHGLMGPITVARQHFNSAMPPYGTNQPMDDSAVAAVLTYVRSAWGNTGSVVTPAEVAAQRAATASRTTPWTAKDLQALLQAGGR